MRDPKNSSDRRRRPIALLVRLHRALPKRFVIGEKHAAIEVQFPRQFNCEPGLEPLSATDSANVANRIQQFEGMCSDEATWLYGHSIYEWTGNYEDDYVWVGFTNWNVWGGTDGYVGIQWPYLDNWYTLAHEGSHGVHHWGEGQATARGNYCTQYLY